MYLYMIEIYCETLFNKNNIVEIENVNSSTDNIKRMVNNYDNNKPSDYIIFFNNKVYELRNAIIKVIFISITGQVILCSFLDNKINDITRKYRLSEILELKKQNS